ncbi:hypothetical protein GCM10007916_29040 [Psychromonas marina]|uniref:histidine kinase n=1 Tax=Psychromonas marina TaxID=88364 RepID=A0ABQ6E320_9GAMM|nr:hybrid sensor histidine kinase/response regulator [Psychromonas marina]GLS91834.1 hypothetical protein GCM10007916_29040 [Psychromonas marina]
MKSSVREFKKVIGVVFFSFVFLIGSVAYLYTLQTEVGKLNILRTFNYEIQSNIKNLFQDLHVARESFLYGNKNGLAKANRLYSELLQEVYSFEEMILIPEYFDKNTLEKKLSDLSHAKLLLQKNQNSVPSKIDDLIERGALSGSGYYYHSGKDGYFFNREKVDNTFRGLFSIVIDKHAEKSVRLLYELRLLSGLLICHVLFIAFFCGLKFVAFYKNMILPVEKIYKELSNTPYTGGGFPINSHYLEMNKLHESIQSGFEENNKLITELKQSANTINQLNFEIKNKLINKSNFLSMVSHDIRTPLNSVIVGLSLIDSKDFSPYLKREFIDISNGCQYLLNFVNSLMSFSKLDNPNEFVVPEVISTIFLEEWILEISSLLTPWAKRYNIKCYIYIGNGFPESFNSNSNVLSQVVVNIANNAVMHSKASVIRIKLSYDASKSTVSVSIIDFGIGIKNVLSSKIFNQYESSSSSKGNGLGLFISKSLIENLGGSISVFSSFGRGTKFSFTLPIDIPEHTLLLQLDNRKQHNRNRGYIGRYFSDDFDEATFDDHSCLHPFMNLNLFEQLPSVKKEMTNLSNVRILIAEDVPMNVRLMKKVVKKFNFNACFASNGIQVLEIIEEENVDIILMDIQMPLMGGLEATKLIKSSALFSGITIIGLSAQADPKTEAKCLEAGMLMLMSKPFDVSKLTEIINSISDIKRKASLAINYD